MRDVISLSNNHFSTLIVLTKKLKFFTEVAMPRWMEKKQENEDYQFVVVRSIYCHAEYLTRN